MIAAVSLATLSLRVDPVGPRLSRRAAVAGLVALPAALVAPPQLPVEAAAVPPAVSATLGSRWVPLTAFTVAEEAVFPEAFVMYLARLFVAYDATTADWYREQRSAIPPSWSEAKVSRTLQQRLGSIGASVHFGLRPYAGTGSAGAADLWARLNGAWADRPGGSAQLALLFSLLSAERQPLEPMGRALQTQGASGRPLDAAAIAAALAATPHALLPAEMVPMQDAATGGFAMPAPLRQAGVFGTVGRAPVSEERKLDALTYGRFAAAGATGCALTHALVVPLDVVKTRLQTRPGKYSGFGDAAATIAREEGGGMLLQGMGATIGGYLCYGISVYPGYELLKRVAFELAGAQGVLEYRVPLVLGAGALATMFTCLLITPWEAVRIRMVERPDFAPDVARGFARYAEEGGAASLYDGLPPLMVRQVLFGMVKFLIFDSCSDAILAQLPADARAGAAVALGVSLLSGAIAGVAAAVVSQPADVLLTRVARGGGECAGALPGDVNQLRLLQTEALAIYRNYGPGGFYLGLGSRCLWSGAIIAGQFFLYDVFKGMMHVTANDLSLFYDAMSMLPLR